MSLARVRSGKYLPTGSSTESLPSSASRKMHAAVNCLVMEPMAKRVSGSTGAPVFTDRTP